LAQVRAVSKTQIIPGVIFMSPATAMAARSMIRPVEHEANPDDVCWRGRIQRDLNSLPKWKQWFFKQVALRFQRFCYLRLGLPTMVTLDQIKCPHCQQQIEIENGGAWIEAEGIYFDPARARENINGDPDVFVMQLPADRSLPCETVQYGVHDFPENGASHQYQRRRFPSPVVSMPGSQYDQIVAGTKGIEEELRKTRSVLDS
jgi:hypothetical protein